MKKQLLACAIAAFMAKSFAQQPQINNGGFETWPANAKAPTNWSTIESAFEEAGAGLFLSGKKFSSKETAPGNYVEGNQAISIQNDEINVGQTVKIPGTLIYGKLVINIAAQTFRPVPLPFNGKPDAFKFSYRYAPVGNDTASFFVGLSKYNQLVDSSENIAGTFDRLLATSGSNWDTVTSPIEYNPMYAGQSPDSVLIGFIAGGANTNKGSKLWIDNLRFVYATPSQTVEIPVETPWVNVYPNPASTFLHLDPQHLSEDCTISIYSIHGKLSIQRKVEYQRFDISELPNGHYLFTVTNRSKITGFGKFSVVK